MLTAAKMNTEELEHIEETQTKQIKFLEQTRLQLEQRIANMNAEANKLKAGQSVSR